MEEGNKINENNRVLFINFTKGDSNTWQHLAGVSQLDVNEEGIAVFLSGILVILWAGDS